MTMCIKQQALKQKVQDERQWHGNDGALKTGPSVETQTPSI